MANDRGAGQKLIPIPASEDFIRELNSGFKKIGYSNRSQFIRDAILEKLARKGVVIPPELALPPDRLMVNDKPVSSANTPDPAKQIAVALTESSERRAAGGHSVQYPPLTKRTPRKGKAAPPRAGHKS